MKPGPKKTSFLAVRFPRMLRRTAKAFITDRVSWLGAALAFYTTIAVAPLLVLTIAFAGLFFENEEAARSRVVGEIESLAGKQASAVVDVVQSPEASSGGRMATAISAATMLFGAFGVFYHLQDALNAIWHVPAPKEGSWWRTLRKRLFSIAMVLVTGFLLLVSLIASAMLTWVSANTLAHFKLPTIATELVELAISLAMVTVLFAVIFRLLPDTKVSWRETWPGAFFTALLFTGGKNLLGLYLANAKIATAYGAAGSLIVLLLWCYYASQIFFFGAEFTRINHLSDSGRDWSAMDRPVKRNLSI